jgi:hypothetical protein
MPRPTRNLSVHSGKEFVVQGLECVRVQVTDEFVGRVRVIIRGDENTFGVSGMSVGGRPVANGG